MAILTNLLLTQPDLNAFSAMRLDSSILSQGVMDFDEQCLWLDTDMHSDRDVLEYPSVLDVHMELVR